MRQAVERCDDVVERVEVVHTIGTTPEFSRCLWPAQKKDANDRDFPPVEVEYFLQPVLVFCNPAVGSARGTGQSFLLKRAESVADGVLVEIHHRLAIIFLITRVDESVERERIVIRGGYVFLDQGTENTGFDFGEDHDSILIHDRGGTGTQKGKSPASSKIAGSGASISQFT